MSCAIIGKNNANASRTFPLFSIEVLVTYGIMYSVLILDLIKLNDSYNMSKSDQYSVSVEIPYPNEKLAQIVYNSLRVDIEPKRSEVHKSLHVENSVLKVRVSSSEVKNVRVSMNSFFDLLTVVNKTIDRFGPPL